MLTAFNPLDFLELARRLHSDVSCRGVEEAAARTSISRAYYAVFLSLREFIKKRIAQVCQVWIVDCYSDVVRTGLAHMCVKDLIGVCDKYLGKLYGKLFLLRKRSDYELEAVLRRKDVEEALAIAGRLAERYVYLGDMLDAEKVTSIVLGYYERLKKSRESSPYL